MRNKPNVMGDKMSVVDGAIDDARNRAVFMLNKKFRGVGDTIERAAYDCETSWGVPASILLRLRGREVNDMLLSNWVAVMVAAAAAGYKAACEQSESVADQQEKIAKDTLQNAAHSKLLAAAAYLARPKDGAAE